MLPRSSIPARLHQLIRVWRVTVDGAWAWAWRFALGALWLGLAHLARLGTGPARAGAAVLAAVAVLGVVAERVLAARRWRDPRRAVRHSLVRSDPEAGQRVERALGLLDRTLAEPNAGASEFARLHLERQVSRMLPQVVAEGARRRARYWNLAALAAAALCTFVLTRGPFMVVEGLAVLAARNGSAPVHLTWLKNVMAVGHPPEYLHEHDLAFDDLSAPLHLPHGSVLTVTGVPSRPGRDIVLSDGKTVVPFVNDGASGLLARWPVRASGEVRIAARFGSVFIHEAEALDLHSIPDAPPAVRVAGAPRSVRLIDVDEVEIDYEVEDDHGLREVDLVLRSQDREERRVINRFEGDVRRDRGVRRLRARDPFFGRALAPVEVTVEARDNDPLDGAKWGKSAPVTVVIPAVGELAALRYAALKRARDSLVELCAFRIDSEPTLNPRSKAGEKGQRSRAGVAVSKEALRLHGQEEVEHTERAVATAQEALEKAPRSLPLSRHAGAILGGVLSSLRDGAAREAEKVTQRVHADNRRAAEDAALLADTLLRRMGTADAAKVARRLAEVAEEAAEGALRASSVAERSSGLLQLGAALGGLAAGGTELRRLGTLGADLGEIVANDLKRVNRALASADYRHAELAARDLSARLRHPSPSYSGGVGGGVESGPSNPGKGDLGDGDEAARAMARAEDEIAELARDHATEIAAVERAMAEASASDETDDSLAQAREHAAAIRKAASSLPSSPGYSEAFESAVTAGRELAQAMADALERGSFADAVASGRNALGSLEQAQRDNAGLYYGGEPSSQVKRVRAKLEPELEWAEKRLSAMERRASERAADALRHIAPREKALADRAKALQKEEASEGMGLPVPMQDVLEGAERAMHDAAEALAQGHGERGARRQKDAQQLLETVRGGDQDRDAEASEGDNKGSVGDKEAASQRDGRSSQKAAIPKAQDHRGPEDFRLRVMKGLGGAADPRLRDAVKRYA